ncbi:MAG: hypothetical protein V4535_11965 [Bacteroidota bacterium]
MLSEDALTNFVNEIKQQQTMDTTGQESFRISGDWSLQSKLLRRRFPQLTLSDLE